MIHDKTIRVGACDWDHPQWQGSFYPGDLPEDWRLSYYANEFSTVLVPEARWRAVGVEMEEWSDEVPEGFQFYFINIEKDTDEALIKKCLGDKFAGFVNPEETLPVALINFEDKSLREWKSWLEPEKLTAIFLMDDQLAIKQLSDFQKLLEFMGV